MIHKLFLDKAKVLLPILVVFLFSVFLFVFHKGELVLFLNKLHNPFNNYLFRKISSVGNALSVLVFLLIVLRFKFKYLYLFVLAFAIESFVVILCKHWFFDGTPRPYVFFKELGVLDQIDFVAGVKIRKRDSFPSGHTAYSFCMAVFFMLKINKRLPSVLLMCLACFIGVSRMYLVQHFFIDVFTGALVGIFSALVAFVVVFSKSKKWYNYRIKVNLKNQLKVAYVNENV